MKPGNCYVNISQIDCEQVYLIKTFDILLRQKASDIKKYYEVHRH